MSLAERFNEWGRQHPWALMVLTSAFIFVFLVAFELYALDQSLGESLAFAGAFSVASLAVKAVIHLRRTKQSP